MVLLKVTPKILAAIQQCRDQGILDNLARVESEPSLEDSEIGNPISYGQIIDIANLLEKHGSGEVGEFALGALLHGSEVYEEPKGRKGSEKESYEELMARLRREQEDREYERMLADQSTHTPNPLLRSIKHKVPLTKTAREEQEKEGDETTYSDVNRQLMLVINVLITVICCGIGIWLVARWWSTPARLALSMGGAIAVGVAEVAIYMGYLRRVQEARVSERRKSERKTIIDTWVIGGKGNKATSKDPVALREAGTGNEKIRQRKKVR